MLPREARLTRPEDFRRVRAEGRSWAHPMLVLCRLPNGREVTRFGFSVSGRLGGAVVRNRVKRMVSEAVRLQYDLVEPGWDVVFIARRGIIGARWEAVTTAVNQLLARAHLYATEVTTQADRRTA